MGQREDTIQGIIETLSRLQRPIEHNAWRVMGLSRAQVGMLYMLLCHQSCSGKQIANHLGISQSAVTQLVEPLIDRALVARRPDAKDRRVMRLVLTTNGRALLKKFRKHRTEGLRNALDNLPAAELGKLAAISQKMALNAKTN